MQKTLSLVLALVLSGGVIGGSALAENWPSWRGPGADSVSHETGVPLHWGRGKNIVWQTKLEGLGMSTPIVWEDRIFLTAQIGRGIVEARSAKEVGVPANDGAPVTFLIQCYRSSDGKLLWERRIQPALPLPVVHPYHNLASASCVTDGTRLYAWFGTGQLLCLSLDGKDIWERNLGKDYSPFQLSWGPASSPVLHQNSLYLLCDHEVDGYLLALDKKTGRTLWKTDRGKDLRSYATPVVIPVENKFEILINSSKRLDAYDAATGELKWNADDFACKAPVPTPVFFDGVIYASRGFNSGPYMALRPGGHGDVSSSRMLWRVATGAPYVSSLLFYDGLIYLATEVGVVRCIDPKTGETVWVERLGGNFSASPVGAEGRIYLLNEDGESIVLAAGRKPVILARNDLAEPCRASPVISGSRLFIRTDYHLFCIGKE